jgi:hypothetical protein
VCASRISMSLLHHPWSSNLHVPFASSLIGSPLSTVWWRVQVMTLLITLMQSCLQPDYQSNTSISRHQMHTSKTLLECNCFIDTVILGSWMLKRMYLVTVNTSPGLVWNKLLYLSAYDGTRITSRVNNESFVFPTPKPGSGIARCTSGRRVPFSWIQ